jgi:hypothetical protein
VKKFLKRPFIIITVKSMAEVIVPKGRKENKSIIRPEKRANHSPRW